MKRIILVLSLIIIMALSGCSTETISSGQGTDYPAAIMVEDSIYLLSTETLSTNIDENEITGYTKSYTDGLPEKNGETNFNRELEMPFAKVEGGIAVFYEDNWYLCTPEE